ncbi:MAG: hypothetical protein HYW57_07640 [Ignavibacteriales bacterium]|nr:hypothetical protein [Ignavibacteriales bacterium]
MVIRCTGVLLFFFPLLLLAGEPVRGVRSAALASAGSALPVNPWSVDLNSAWLSFAGQTSLALFSIPHQHGLAELRTVAAAACLPLPFGGGGVSVERFGFDLYNESAIKGGFGWRFTEIVSAGVTVTGKFISIQGYGSRWVPLVATGVALKPFDELLLGGVATNVFGASVGATKERLPQTISWGLTWIPEELFLATFELSKDVRFPLVVRGGIERSILPGAAVRVGIISNPRTISAGGSVTVLGAEFGYAGKYHPDLGWTHHVEVALEIGE